LVGGVLEVHVEVTVRQRTHVIAGDEELGLIPLANAFVLPKPHALVARRLDAIAAMSGQ
jgi:hypothetical protein